MRAHQIEDCGLRIEEKRSASAAFLNPQSSILNRVEGGHA
jgi:hypothetical protein